jgi:hypothetical protein
VGHRVGTMVEQEVVWGMTPARWLRVVVSHVDTNRFVVVVGDQLAAVVSDVLRLIAPCCSRCRLMGVHQSSQLQDFD